MIKKYEAIALKICQDTKHQLDQGPKFVRNCSISYSFPDKQHFPFPTNFKMASKIWKILNFSEALSGSKICPKLLYLLGFFESSNISILAIIQDGSQNSDNSKFLRGL